MSTSLSEVYEITWACFINTEADEKSCVMSATGHSMSKEQEEV